MLNWLWDIQNRILSRPGNRNLASFTISESSSPFAVRNGFEWILRAEGADCERLAGLFADLMRKVQPHEWVQIYAEFRGIDASSADVVRFADLPSETAVELLGIVTFSHNGRTRESALKALGNLAHSRAVPYVLLRLGDWVPEVRRAAWDALQALMSLGIAKDLLCHYALIERLQGIRRCNLQPVIDGIQTYLRSDEASPEIEAAFRSGTSAVRLFAFRLLQGRLTADLITEAVSDPAPAIRAWLVRWLASSPERGHADLVNQLLRDGSSYISTRMIGALDRDQIIQHRDCLLDLAFSDTGAVRNAARFAVHQAGEFDFAAEARRLILAASPDTMKAGVVATLGETGTASDFALVRPILASRRSVVRKAAVEACMRLGKDEAVDSVVALLDNPARGVRLAVAGMLAGTDLLPWYPTIREILRSGSAGGQRQALGLLILQGGWEAVPEMLCGLSSEHESVRRYAWWSIEAWYRKYKCMGWLKPSEAVRSALRQELARLEDRVVEFTPSSDHHWQDVKRWIAREVNDAAD